MSDRFVIPQSGQRVGDCGSRPQAARWKSGGRVPAVRSPGCCRILTGQPLLQRDRRHSKGRAATGAAGSPKTPHRPPASPYSPARAKGARRGVAPGAPARAGARHSGTAHHRLARDEAGTEGVRLVRRRPEFHQQLGGARSAEVSERRRERRSCRDDASVRNASFALARRIRAPSKFADSSKILVVASRTSLFLPPIRSGEAERAAFVGDDDRLGRDRALRAVERRESFHPSAAVAHDECDWFAISSHRKSAAAVRVSSMT